MDVSLTIFIGGVFCTSDLYSDNFHFGGYSVLGLVLSDNFHFGGYSVLRLGLSDNFHLGGGGGGGEGTGRGVFYRIGVNCRIWTKISTTPAGSCITDSLSNTTYVETNDHLVVSAASSCESVWLQRRI